MHSPHLQKHSHGVKTGKTHMLYMWEAYCNKAFGKLKTAMPERVMRVSKHYSGYETARGRQHNPSATS